jgi:NAD(P)-dependent dehydrogenase (short-subunit alcohol dehydrogenase family)
VNGFVERAYNVVDNSRKVTLSTAIAASNHVALVDGHIGEEATAAKIVETALSRFKSIDALVNNAGLFFFKPFTEYTAEDFKSLVSTNLEGFLYITQFSIKQMLAQRRGGSIVTITAALARNPIRGVTASVPMVTKGGIETITQQFAMEYAKDGIRVNAIAPGFVSRRFGVAARRLRKRQEPLLLGIWGRKSPARHYGPTGSDLRGAALT